MNRPVLKAKDVYKRQVQAAVGNRGGVQEGGVDVVIAVLTDDLLRQIGEALHILTVERSRHIPAAIGLQDVYKRQVSPWATCRAR